MQSLSGPKAGQNVVFAAIYSGASAAGVVALMILVIDSLRGMPLATPSILSSALFLGEVPADPAQVRVDLVAIYSLVHAAAFLGLGALSTLAYARFEAIARQPIAFAGLIAATLSGVAVALDPLVLSGALESIGSLTIFSANAVAACWSISASPRGVL